MGAMWADSRAHVTERAHSDAALYIYKVMRSRGRLNYAPAHHIPEFRGRTGALLVSAQAVGKCLTLDVPPARYNPPQE
jgi:hypothetical protein